MNTADSSSRRAAWGLFLLRILVGWAFLSEGIQKFLFPAALGTDFIGINPVKALYWTAVINGLLAPFLLVAILIVAADKKLMQSPPSSRLGWILVAISTMAVFVERRYVCCVACRQIRVRRFGFRAAQTAERFSR
jgi:hypothetical protein